MPVAPVPVTDKKDDAKKDDAKKDEVKKDDAKKDEVKKDDAKKDDAKKDDAKKDDAKKDEVKKDSASAKKPAGAVKKKVAKKVSDDPMDDPEYVAMLKRKKMKMNLIVFGVCFGITVLLAALVLGLKSCGNKQDGAKQTNKNGTAGKVEKAGKSTKAIPQAEPREILTDVQKEFNKKYAELMKVKESDPGKFDEAKLDFISYFSGVAQANGLTRTQLLQYNELAKDFGMEVEVPEETASDSGAEGGESTASAATATPGGNPAKSKEYKADYDKLYKYLNANGNVTRRFSKPEKIMDELDKQLGMMREFMDNWETFPKTETEQKYYDNVLRIYKKTQQSRDMYAM